VVHAGGAAISFEPDRWAGLYFHHAGVDVAPYGSIELWVHGGPAGGQLVKLRFLRGSQLLGDVLLSEALGGPVAPGAWQRVSVPLAQLGLASGTFDAIYLQDWSGADQGTLYVDDVRLVAR
jgi:hypothetical protein